MTMKECEYIEIKNRLGSWTLPAKFTPKSEGGDNEGVHGVIGLTAIGEMHSVHIPQMMAFSLLLKGYIDNEARSTGTKKPVIVDAGAHIGTISVMASHFFAQYGVHSKFYSVEMLPEIFHCLEKNISENFHLGFASAYAVNAALVSNNIREKQKIVEVPSICDGWDFLNQPATAGCLSYDLNNEYQYEKNEVNTLTIDELLTEEEDAVAIIKVDCEGNDLDVLKGALNVIKKNRPIILFESHEREQACFSIENDKSIDRNYFFRFTNLVTQEFRDFFEKINYRVVRNWMYTSWDEYVAIPCEDWEKTKNIVEDHFKDFNDDDMHVALVAYNKFIDEIPLQVEEKEKLVDGLLSIVTAWEKPETEKWFKKNKITTLKDLRDYAEKLLKC